MAHKETYEGKLELSEQLLVTCGKNKVVQESDKLKLMGMLLNASQFFTQGVLLS